MNEAGTDAAGDQAVPDLEALAEDLLKTFRDVAGQLDKRSRRVTRLVWGVTVVSIVMLALVIGVVALSVNQSRVSARVHEGQLTGCAIGNQTRYGQVLLWHRIIRLSGPAKTRAEQENRQKILRYVNQLFYQLNCRKIYGR
jgi:hypothetical protein